MNKQYIKESADDIGFILIDDPVQTMDDINISSLIEVLRNDFLNKQIILSTHEMDKENYILYKFFKYSQVGQSFNVKEEIYEVWVEFTEEELDYGYRVLFDDGENH